MESVWNENRRDDDPHHYGRYGEYPAVCGHELYAKLRGTGIDSAEKHLPGLGHLTFMTVSSCIMRQGQSGRDRPDAYNVERMEAFGRNAPTYHIELRDQRCVVWDFHSLMLDIKMMFSLMLTDEAKPLRMCKNCQRAFIAERSNMVFLFFFLPNTKL